jgi:hypothetical protein
MEDMTGTGSRLRSAIRLIIVGTQASMWTVYPSAFVPHEKVKRKQIGLD